MKIKVPGKTHLGKVIIENGIVDELNTTQCCGTRIVNIPYHHDFTEDPHYVTCPGDRIPFHVLPDGTDVFAHETEHLYPAGTGLSHQVTLETLHRVLRDVPRLRSIPFYPGRQSFVGRTWFRDIDMNPHLEGRVLITLGATTPLTLHAEWVDVRRSFRDVIQNFPEKRDFPVFVRSEGDEEAPLTLDMMYRILYQVRSWSLCRDDKWRSVVPFSEGFPRFLRWLEKNSPS